MVQARIFRDEPISISCWLRTRKFEPATPLPNPLGRRHFVLLFHVDVRSGCSTAACAYISLAIRRLRRPRLLARLQSSGKSYLSQSRHRLARRRGGSKHGGCVYQKESL